MKKISLTLCVLAGLSVGTYKNTVAMPMTNNQNAASSIDTHQFRNLPDDGYSTPVMVRILESYTQNIQSTMKPAVFMEILADIDHALTYKGNRFEREDVRPKAVALGESLHDKGQEIYENATKKSQTSMRASMQKILKAIGLRSRADEAAKQMLYTFAESWITKPIRMVDLTEDATPDEAASTPEPASDSTISDVNNALKSYDKSINSSLEAAAFIEILDNLLNFLETKGVHVEHADVKPHATGLGENLHMEGLGIYENAPDSASKNSIRAKLVSILQKIATRVGGTGGADTMLNDFASTWQSKEILEDVADEEELTPQDQAKKEADGFLHDFENSLQEHRDTMGVETLKNYIRDIHHAIQEGNHGFGKDSNGKLKHSSVEASLINFIAILHETAKAVFNRADTEDHRPIRSRMMHLLSTLKSVARNPVPFHVRHAEWKSSRKTGSMS